ncbi:MAG TPA: pirin family protein [Polyangiaceae bacterium]
MPQSNSSALERVIVAKSQQVAGFPVRRVLPSRQRRRVGPWTFIDHMGPARLTPDRPMRVPPHPHLNLATVTYLFEGELVHRDSLGSCQSIQPGAINWMHAGRGVVHSETSPVPLTPAAEHLHGLQLWLALPREREESDPWFQHTPAVALPLLAFVGGEARVLIGEALGTKSPARVESPTLLIDVSLSAGARLDLPSSALELAAYVVSGRVAFEGTEAEPGHLLVFGSASAVLGRGELRALEESRVVLLGGAPLDGERFMFWNFVSSSRERLEEAKATWKQGPQPGTRFPPIPFDSGDFVPLPKNLA